MIFVLIERHIAEGMASTYDEAARTLLRRSFQIEGFISGEAYADINDHLSEYATLKAMGYSDNSLLLVVIQEAIILAIMGFIPGFATSIGLYQLLVNLTKIPLVMQPIIATQVFILTVVMCAVSGAIATTKLRSADPSDIF